MRKKLVVVYSRVSSSSQNLREQLDAANNFLKLRNINKDEVLYLKDFNVSATKNDASNRPAYKRLLGLVSEDKVDTIIIYSRDRGTRDFFEASEFIELVNQHGVEVVYTATDEIPYNKNSSIESFYGIFSQQEGKNIKRRTTDATKRYPGQVIGYERIKREMEDGSKKVFFLMDNDRSKTIKSLFKEFSQVSTKEDFVNVLIKYGKRLNSHSTVIKILQRPFYTAHCITDFGYDELTHVEAIIPLELFEDVQDTLNKFIEEYEEKVSRAKENILLNPICGQCNKEMKFKKALDKPSYFVCSSKHKKVVIELDEVNKVIEETVIKETQQYTLTVYKPIFQSHLKGVLDNLVHSKQHKEHLLKKSMLTLASGNIVSNDQLKKSQMKIQEIQDQIDVIDREIIHVNSLKNEVKTISNIVEPAIERLTESDLETLIELLVKDIKIFQDYLEINMYSLVFEKGVS
ncbi:recombinase family protein [Paucisalibacillus globulus]|uniref:recombinase family protein n=1 Tax=Paucisalibacillus globulus TaxID=351095 RepID=UPI000BB9AFE6|nr:recombinase family protein [Paucisalibacillus globulus]